MNLKALLGDAFPIIAKFAPNIGSAIGGPFGFAAGYILPVLANTFGGDPKNLPGLILNILHDPDTQTKLEKIEHEHGDWLCTTLGSIENLSEAEINIKLKWQTTKEASS